MVSEIVHLHPSSTKVGSRKCLWLPFPPTHSKCNPIDDSNTIDVYECTRKSRHARVQCVQENIEQLSVDSTPAHVATKGPMPLVEEAERNGMDRLHGRDRDPNDPYFAVKAEVEWAVEQVTKEQPWMTESKKRIMIEAAHMELTELEEAVDAMSTNPARFELSDKEVWRRVEETRHLRQKIACIQEESQTKTYPPLDLAESSDPKQSAYQTPAANEIQDENAPLLCTSSSTMPPRSTRDMYEGGKCTWMKESRRDHVALVLSEDEQVATFNKQVMDDWFFGRETESKLDMQNPMLEDLDVGMETARGNLAQARRIMKKLAGDTRCRRYTLICIFIALLIVLVSLFMH